MADNMADTRMVPVAGLREIVTAIMAGREHMGMEPVIRRVDGGWKHYPLPEGQGLTLDHFLTAIADLPDPCPELQAAEAVVQVITDRGYRWLVTELGAEWECRWPGPEQETPDDTGVPDYLPRCAHCGNGIPAERGPRARFCKNSHRVAAAKKRKRGNG